MQSEEIRNRFLNFFQAREHAVIPSASLLPENDPSVLFNTAGMQPIVPYLLGEKHPSGKRLVDIQKCVRTNDIEEIGDKSHLTFFEMMGHWSLGDYFKKEAIEWMWQFLTDTEQGLGLDPNRLYVTVFQGDDNAPLDTAAIDIWQGIVPNHRIYALDAGENWWSAGENGPCGPDTEYFYDTSKQALGDLDKEEFLEHCDSLDIIEICNTVFMEYRKENGVIVGALEQQSIDFGGGLERWATILQNTDTVYETDLFDYAIASIEKHSKQTYADCPIDYRVIADHIRSAVFMISDGALPGNKDQGYILRRLLRRAVGRMRTVGYDQSCVPELLDLIIAKYSPVYGNIGESATLIKTEITQEIEKFAKTLEQGLQEFQKIVSNINTRNKVCIQDFGNFDCTGNVNELSAADAFTLFTTYGFPLDIIKEQANRENLHVDEDGFNMLLSQHQEQSRTASAGKFKGGLAGDSPKIRSLHTATHLMLAGLRQQLGEGINQAGSNTTEERIRFDFTHDTKVSRDVLDQVEEFVNHAISEQAVVDITEMDKQQAKQSGVIGSFWEKYPDIVTVYTMTGPDGTIYSRELCGGPHVGNTGELADFGTFKITKEESSSAGVRRVKASFV